MSCPGPRRIFLLPHLARFRHVAPSAENFLVPMPQCTAGSWRPMTEPLDKAVR